MTRLLAVLLVIAAPAHAATNAEICDRADRENRLGEMSPAQCTCVLSQGDRRMDGALAILWKDALYTGQSRVEEVRALGLSQAKLERQMRRTLRDARRKCGVSNPFGM